MLHKILTFVLCFALVFVPTLAHAEDAPKKVTEPNVGLVMFPLKKNQPAPYSGVLLSPQAAANIIVDYKSMPDKINIEVTKARDDERAICESRITEGSIHSIAEKKIFVARIEENQKEIKILEDRLKKTEGSGISGAVWATGGIVVGVAATVLTVYAVNKASK